jgi:thioredoxin-related protein
MKFAYQTKLLKFFSKDSCPNCPPAKEIAEDLKRRGVIVQYFDVDSVDGRAEAMFYDVMGTPSTVLVDEKGDELMSWRGKTPDKQAILSVFEE